MRFLLLNLILLSTNSQAALNGYAERAAPPKSTTLLSGDLDKELRTAIGPAPTRGSSGQKKDEEILLSAQNARSPQDCNAAAEEVSVTPSTFFGNEKGVLTAEEILTARPLLKLAGRDANFYIQKLKVDYARPRPYEYITGLNPCVPKEVSLAYPSGHATIAKLYANILGNIYPQKRTALLKRAEEIGRHRYVAGVHHPSDIEAGFKLGDQLYDEFMKTKSFKDSLKKIHL